jgi:type IV pilus assembly protein PilN
MRFTINLASQKYEDVRQFYLRWGAAVALLVLLAVFLGFRARSTYVNAKQSGRHIAELKEKIQVLQQEKANAEALLNQPENHDVRDQSSFWNEEFAQKSMSWTELLTDLEKIMPDRAFLVSVAPTLTADRRLKLKMMIAGEKFDDGNELIKRMEASEHFRGPVIDTQSVLTLGKGQPLVQFAVETYFTPANWKQPQEPAGVKEGMQ